MELSDSSSNKAVGSGSGEPEEEEREGSVDHLETPAQLVEAQEHEELTWRSSSVENSHSVEEIEILEVNIEDERRKDLETEKSSVNKRPDDDTQQGGLVGKGDGGGGLALSPAKRRQRNLEMRRKAIDKFEEEMTNFVWDYLSANHAEKFPSADSIYEYSVQTVQHKILQPEVSSYVGSVIEKGGSWAEFGVNRAMEENVQKYLEKLL